MEDVLTVAIERVLEFNAPFCSCILHFEHGDSHDEDHEGSNQLEYP